MSIMFSCFFFLMIRRPPRSTRTDTLSLHDALPIYRLGDHQLALLDILHHPFDRPSGIDEVDTGIGRHLLPVGAIEALEMRDEGAGISFRGGGLAETIEQHGKVGGNQPSVEAKRPEIGRGSWRERVCK